MTSAQIMAYLHIVCGLFLILFFGGKLILQIVGIIAGVMLVKNGLSMLSIIKMNFFNDVKFR